MEACLHHPQGCPRSAAANHVETDAAIGRIVVAVAESEDRGPVSAVDQGPGEGLDE